MLLSRPIATESSPSRTVRSSLLCTTVSSRLRKTTKPLTRPSRSLPGIRQTFSSWSRTQRSTPRPAGGDTVTSARTVHLAATRCSRLAPPATRRLFAILSSPITRVDGPARRQPTYPAVLQVSTSSARRGSRCGEAHNKQAQAEGGRPDEYRLEDQALAKAGKSS